MVIKGDLRDLYAVGEKMLPEMASRFAEAANGIVKTNDAAVEAFSRPIENPHPAKESDTGFGAAWEAWESYRNAVYDVLAKNAEKMNNAAEFVIGAADSYAYQDGHNSDEIEEVKDRVASDEKHVEVKPNDRD